ncbi:hypothetical protein [Rathayibacter tanaceti]|uniref:Uncharacterized protein n=2 Tax=Rathayibacter tanaceti TaxID=1671680 RepID=A0A166HZA1_9MICO|nr:hypothetical protein [Rathayibacter tanaceti]KZX21384.1 hypothetical protein ACH61_01480 [Rathayibacter tanaceti]QHC54949.1 hypothetical protein GSU10_04345 [Rathayibacter tanaceti]TCO38491.1 hypothetical protein EV639_102134 [Rathayibacter tanaceti]
MTKRVLRALTAALLAVGVTTITAPLASASIVDAPSEQTVGFGFRIDDEIVPAEDLQTWSVDADEPAATPPGTVTPQLIDWNQW